MSMWILILTVAIQRYEVGTSVTSVQGFQSEQACEAAAQKWLTRGIPTSYSYGGEAKARAVCVKAS